MEVRAVEEPVRGAPSRGTSLARRRGYGLLLGLLWLGQPLVASAQSICAEVKIQIDQKVSLERQAFDALLRIRNGLDGVEVEHIAVNLVFTAIDGHEASASFFNRLDTVSGISGSVADGTGVVAAATTGDAHWLIIPTPGAGGTVGLNYQIGATVTYRMTGDTADRTVDVIPEIVTVKPQPQLDLDYFLPGDVYADDADTTEIEPTVPFTLGVRIANSGYGTAAHTTIESAQPEIKENHQGLLIGFQIEGSYVDDQAAQPTLLLDFGNIEPAQVRMGRWLMTTTLAGQFSDFSADYTHADDLGGAQTSLIRSVDSHLLTHDVIVNQFGAGGVSSRDGVRDFLAQAVGAAETDTYRVYESDGPVTEVDQDIQDAPMFTGGEISFASQPPGHFVYARRRIDFDGQGRGVTAARADGRTFPPENIWFSKRRTPSDPTWIYFLNVFEANPDCAGALCTYGVTYDGASSASTLTGFVYQDANANGIQDAGEPGMPGITVVASAGDGVFATTASDGFFQFPSLAAGSYTVTVGASAGYFDGMATAGTAGGTAAAGSVSDIVLAAGVQASGYVFSKIAIPPQRVADLAVTGLAASATSPRVGETFTVTLQIANAGPDPALVDAGVTLPATLTVLSANPSVGTFDPATGHFAVGNLAQAGTATLTLQLRSSAEGDISILASVSSSDAAILDPAPGNNVASLALHVRTANEVHVTAAYLRESRVLAFIQCPKTPTTNPGDSCAVNRATAFDNYLAGRSIEHLVTTDKDLFRDELRSGRWNVYWLDNGAVAIDASVLAEVDLGVLRGDSLIVDGAHDAGSTKLDGWIGVSYTGPRSQTSAETITFVANDYLTFSGLSVSAKRYAYAATTGAVIGKYPDATAAVVVGAHGQGRAFLFTFDLINTLTGNSAYGAFFDQLGTASQPAIPTSFSSDGYAPVKLHVENLGLAAQFDTTFAVPATSRIVKTVPAPSVVTAQQAKWTTSLETSATFDAIAGIRTSSNPSSTLTVDVAASVSPGVSLAHQDLALAVANTNALVAIARDHVAALAVSGSTDVALRAAALVALDNAANAHQAALYNDAIGALLAADSDLQQIVGTSTLIPRGDVARAMQPLQREWYMALPECTAVALPAVVDPGISFRPFADTQGLAVRQTGTVGSGSRNGFEWRLGSDTQNPAASVNATTSLVNSQNYQWNLGLDGHHKGTLTVRDNATTLITLSYDPALLTTGGSLDVGNALRLSVGVLNGTTSSSIVIKTTAVDGAPRADTLSATATTTATTASLYYYGKGLADGFSISGTINVIVPRVTTSTAPARITFAVNAGAMSCKVTDR